MLQQPIDGVTDHRLKCGFDLETTFTAGGVWPIAGVDEAGRGPLAGSVAVAAVILDPSDLPDGINDSKLLTHAQRESLYEKILGSALAVSLAFASAAEIDRYNIRAATLQAMARAVAALALAPRLALIDGRDLPPGLACEGRCIVGGDGLSMSIAAASIVAKVTRDRMMSRLAAAYPSYGFERHKGYGTAAHARSLDLHGPCPFHRMSFAPIARRAAR